MGIIGERLVQMFVEFGNSFVERTGVKELIMWAAVSDISIRGIQMQFFTFH